MLETSTDKDVSVDDILPKLMVVEQRLHSSDTERSQFHETALKATETCTCFYCGKKGHLKRNCLLRKREEAHGSPQSKMVQSFGAIAL